MNNKELVINSVEKSRKKYFKETKFKKYNDLLDTMQIPEQFNYLNCIPSVFSNPEYENIKKFKKDRYNNLYKEVKQYAEENTKKTNDSYNITILVHPFYPSLRHANFLIEFEEYYEKYLIYEKKIENLLANSENNIILFESPDNFARYTYSFLKFNSIRKVIFTEHSTGKILSEEKIEELGFIKNKKIKVIGCYGDNCVKDVEEQLRDCLNEDMDRENDLILNRAIKI